MNPIALLMIPLTLFVLLLLFVALMAIAAARQEMDWEKWRTGDEE